MTKTEAMRQTAQENTLLSLGFTTDEAAALRRISLTLRRWHERECGDDQGVIERDDTTGKPYLVTQKGRRWPVADRETGARRRLAAIIQSRNERAAEPILNTYIQTDPRGAALYILRPDDVPEGKDPAAYYSRGICIY